MISSITASLELLVLDLRVMLGREHHGVDLRSACRRRTCTVTCDFASGRSHVSLPLLRSSACFSTRRCAR